MFLAFLLQRLMNLFQYCFQRCIIIQIKNFNYPRSEEENIIISDLSPATWYSIQLTAHNGAGSRVLTSQVATLDRSGQPLAPRGVVSTSSTPLNKAGGRGGAGGVDGSVAIPIISAILITTTIMMVAVYIYRKRR